MNGKHSFQSKKTNNDNLAKYTLENMEIRFDILRKFLIYLQEWKEEAHQSTSRKEDRAAMMLSSQTLTGIEMTIRSFIAVATYLLND